MSSSILLTSRLFKGAKRLEMSSRGDFGDKDVEAWTLYALDRGAKPGNYRPFRDALTTFFLSFLPFVRSPLINRLADRYSPTQFTPEALLLTLALGLFLAGAAAFAGESPGGGALVILLAIAAFVGVFAVANRPQVVVAPSQPRAPPPRQLAIVDSWHAVAVGCGTLAGAFEESFVAAFKAASRDPSLGVSLAPEEIKYDTGNGYEERHRLVVSRNQANVLVDLHATGDDLYVGWHGYLNWAQWIESAPVSVRLEDGVDNQFRALGPGLYWPNEFDLVDLSCIADLVHRALRSELERLLKDREIDEEIDFEIVRGDRQRAFDADRHAGNLADPDKKGDTWTDLMQAMGSWRSAGSGRATEDPLTYGSPALPRHGQRRSYPKALPSFVLLLGLSLVMSLVSPYFLASANVSTVLNASAIVGILGVAQTLVVMTAGIDLSIGMIMAISTVVVGYLANTEDVPVALALAIGLLVGAGFGWLNGMLITRMRMPPFIVTFATMSIISGLSMFYSNGKTIFVQVIEENGSLLQVMGNRISVGDIHIMWGTFLMLSIGVIAWYALNQTAYGRSIYRTGQDPEAARLDGINTDRVILSVYILAGFLSAVAGWVFIGRLGAISPTAGWNANLNSIAAVVVGGTSLFGGGGSIVGTLIGALVVAVLQAALIFAGFEAWWQEVAIGVLVIVGVALSQRDAEV